MDQTKFHRSMSYFAMDQRWSCSIPWWTDDISFGPVVSGSTSEASPEPKATHSVS